MDFLSLLTPPRNSAEPPFRAENDARLAAELLANPDVKRAIVKSEADRKHAETRRRLLATAVRLGPRVAPALNRVVDECRDKLGVDAVIELYAYPSPHLNAGVVRPEGARLFVLFSSEILEGFEEDELRFVTGHELGHYVFRHHDIPVHELLADNDWVSPSLALRLFTWSRWAEISADRAGLFCAGHLESAARAFLKLASGLRSMAASLRIDEFLAQIDDMETSMTRSAGEGSDWLSTHPFNPLRLKAAQSFSQSEFMVERGTDRGELERQVADVMSIMEPSYLKGTSDDAKAMRRLLLAAGVTVAAASGDIEEREVEALEELLGLGVVSDELDIAALRDDLPSRVAEVVELASRSRRAQLLRDLGLIALADGRVDPQEREILYQVARGLELTTDLVDRTLDAVFDLD